MRRTPMHDAVLCTLLLGLGVGCGPAVVGEWESSERIQQERSQLVVEEAFVANATVWIFRTVGGAPTAQRFSFDVAWQERRGGESYLFEMSCRDSPYGDCDVEDDFRMVCDLEGDDDRLSCEVDDNPRWAAYGFAWHKVE